MWLGVFCSLFLTAFSSIQSDTPNIAGVWVLNPALTVKPDEIGFATPRRSEPYVTATAASAVPPKEPP